MGQHELNHRPRLSKQHLPQIGQRSKCTRYTSAPHIYSTKQANVSLPSAPFAIGPNDGVHNFASLTIGLLATFSRGNVTISSSNAANAAIINPAFLTHLHDITLAIAAIKLARHLASTSSLRLDILEEVIPGPALITDAEIIAHLRQSVATFYHASCTCKMGRRNDSMAVVDSKARVIGITGLRVVDASVFPLLVPGQPQATVYMLAEKIAEVGLGDA